MVSVTEAKKVHRVPAFRVPDELWDAFCAEAARHRVPGNRKDRGYTAVLTEALRGYLGKSHDSRLTESQRQAMDIGEAVIENFAPEVRVKLVELAAGLQLFYEARKRGDASLPPLLDRVRGTFQPPGKPSKSAQGGRKRKRTRAV